MLLFYSASAESAGESQKVFQEEMRNIFEKIVNFMEENGSIQAEYRDVYVYALQTIVVYLFNIGSGIFIGVFMGEIFYCMIFLIAFILLRQEAGGYHAPGWKSCYFLSCGILVLTLLWIKEKFIYQKYMTILIAMTAGAGILFFAPLEDKNKPLEDWKRKTIRKKAQLIVVAESIAGAVLLMIDEKAAYAVLCAVAWCGVNYLAWAVKRYLEGNEKNRENNC